MKKVFLVFLFAAGISFFGKTQTMAQRQHMQHSRIHQGVATGELSEKEIKFLRQEQKQIGRMKKRAKSDCKMTRAEKARINKKQNQANRHIRRFKNN